MELLAVVRVRGTGGVDARIEKTLRLLRLTKPHHCVVIPRTPEYEGMLKKAKDHITWGEISPETLEKLVRERGRLPGNKRPDDKTVKEALKDLKEKGKTDRIKPVFRLNPPRKGYERKGIKKGYKQGGALGYRGEAINQLLERMI